MPREVENTERVSTYITPEQLAGLKEIAKSKGMSLSGYIRLLIAESISKQ